MESLPRTRMKISLLLLGFRDVFWCLDLERMTIYLGVLGLFLDVVRVGEEQGGGELVAP